MQELTSFEMVEYKDSGLKNMNCPKVRFMMDRKPN